MNQHMISINFNNQHCTFLSTFLFKLTRGYIVLNPLLIFVHKRGNYLFSEIMAILIFCENYSGETTPSSKVMYSPKGIHNLFIGNIKKTNEIFKVISKMKFRTNQNEQKIFFNEQIFLVSSLSLKTLTVSKFTTYLQQIITLFAY